MSREYDVRLSDLRMLQTAKEYLSRCHHVKVPDSRERTLAGSSEQFWLRSDESSDGYDMRVFPTQDGFFLEVGFIDDKLRGVLKEWLDHLARHSHVIVLDHDSDEAVAIADIRM